MKNKTHWKKHFNYDYLGTYSLPEGKDIILTIRETKKESVMGQNGQSEDCLICYWIEDEKPMILNRTNCKIIHKLYRTPYVEEWKGKQIQIYAQSGIKAFGSVTDGLRVRDFIPDSKINKEEKELSEKVRNALKAYKGEDAETIRTILNDKRKAGEMTITFLAETLKTLTT